MLKSRDGTVNIEILNIENYHICQHLLYKSSQEKIVLAIKKRKLFSCAISYIKMHIYYHIHISVHMFEIYNLQFIKMIPCRVGAKRSAIILNFFLGYSCF